MSRGAVWAARGQFDFKQNSWILDNVDFTNTD